MKTRMNDSEKIFARQYTMYCICQYCIIKIPLFSLVLILGAAADNNVPNFILDNLIQKLKKKK